MKENPWDLEGSNAWVEPPLTECEYQGELTIQLHNEAGLESKKNLKRNDKNIFLKIFELCCNVGSKKTDTISNLLTIYFQYCPDMSDVCFRIQQTTKSLSHSLANK